MEKHVPQEIIQPSDLFVPDCIFESEYGKLTLDRVTRMSEAVVSF